MWETLPFEECIQKVKTPFKLHKKDYKDFGKYPVVSQEASLISGFHDDVNHVYKVATPVVVFGDHTQTLKYIDFDFVMGADGAKILKPVSALDAKFLYYSLEALMPGSKGYARHYSLLKKLNIKFPSLADQRRIVEKVDELVSKVGELGVIVHAQEKLLDDLADARLQFSIAKAADRSSAVTLGSICTVTSSKRIFKSEYVADGVPFYRTKEIKELAAGKPIKLELFIARDRYEEIRDKYGVPQIGDVLLSAVGTIGEVLEVQDSKEFYFKDGNIVWLKNLQGVRSDYLALFLESSVKQFNEKAQGSAYSALTIEKLNVFPIPLPSLALQETIVAQHRLALKEIATLRARIEAKKSKVIELKKALVFMSIQEGNE
jgi:type I restriction enzyme S subunit